MSDSEILVKVEGISKKFCRSLKKSLWYGMQDIARELNPFMRTAESRKQKADTSEQKAENREHKSEDSGANAKFRPSDLNFANDTLRSGEFWAVNDVAFELRRGECLCLIGRNGAGKTTLLRMLNGLIKPDAGRIEMRGRVGALIALGAGFNPILTGRENIYVNGSVLGLTKREIDEKVEDIIDFADIRDFIDTPVQSYSSGMQVRLGFAVATALEPDVLLLDEVLAVGDAAFRNKCYRRIVSLRKRAAVIFVTHNMEQVARICDRALVLSKGTVTCRGGVAEGIAAYERLNEGDGDSDEVFLSVAAPILDFSCAVQPSRFDSGAAVSLHVQCRASMAMRDFLLRITFFNASGAFAADCNFSSTLHRIELREGENNWVVKLAPVALKRGCYRISMNLVSPSGDFVVWSHKQHVVNVEGGYSGAIADYQLQLHTWRELTQAAPAREGQPDEIGRQ